jgi:hypothetical protein
VADFEEHFFKSCHADSVGTDTQTFKAGVKKSEEVFEIF